MTQLLGLCGSLRAASLNRKLLHEAARLYGAELTFADLRLPLYDGDLEQAEGIPTTVATLAAQIAKADAVLIATPEYNKALSGALKNALDWVSRTEGKPWLGKPVALMSATGGRTGGERAQSSLRACMLPFRADIVPGPEILIAGATGEFDASGRLTNDRYLAGITDVMTQLRAKVAA